MNIIEEYAKLRKLIDELEAEKRNKEVQVIEYLQKTGEKSADSQYGKVTYSTKTKYTYSDKVVKKEAQYKKLEEKAKAELKEAKIPLELMQIEEVKKGIAKGEDYQTVSFKAI